MHRKFSLKLNFCIMIPNTSLRIAGEKLLFFFPLLNHLSGLIKVDRIKRVVSVG